MKTIEATTKVANNNKMKRKESCTHSRHFGGSRTAAKKKKKGVGATCSKKPVKTTTKKKPVGRQLPSSHHLLPVPLPLPGTYTLVEENSRGEDKAPQKHEERCSKAFRLRNDHSQSKWYKRKGEACIVIVRRRQLKARHHSRIAR